MGSVVNLAGYNRFLIMHGIFRSADMYWTEYSAGGDRPRWGSHRSVIDLPEPAVVFGGRAQDAHGPAIGAHHMYAMDVTDVVCLSCFFFFSFFLSLVPHRLMSWQYMQVDAAAAFAAIGW